MLGVIAIVLLVLWLTGNLAFHTAAWVADGLIHVLLVIAIVLGIIWLIQSISARRNRTIL